MLDTTTSHVPSLNPAGIDQNRLDELLTIIVVSYNSEAVISECLSELLNCPPCRVLIVDNASSDNSATLLAGKFPRSNILPQSINLGYGRAANVGLKKTTTPYALLLNPDIIATRVEITALLSAAIADSPATAIWGPAEQQVTGDRSPTKSGSWISGCAMLFHMPKLEEIGFFDENIFLFFEETDLCERTHKAGYVIKRCDQIHFNHLVGKSSAPSTAIKHLKDWHYGWSRSYYHDKHGLASGKRSPRRMLATYSRKALFALGSKKRAKYRSHAQGTKAFLNGEAAFLPDGTPQAMTAVSH